MASSSKTTGYMDCIKFAIIVAFVPSVCFCYPTFGGQPNAAEQKDYTVPPAYNVHQPPAIYPSKSQYTYGPASSSSIVYQQQQAAQKPAAALVYVDQPSPPVQYYQPGSEPQYAVGAGQYVAAASSTTEAPSGIWKFFSMPIFSIPDFFSKKPEEQQQQQVPIPTYYVPAQGNAPAASDAYYNYAILQHPPSKYPLYQVSAPNSAVVKPPSTYVNVNGRPSSSSYYSQPITSYLQRPNISAKVTSGKPTTTTPSSLSAQLPAYSIYLVPSKQQQQQQQPQASPLAVNSVIQPSYNPYNYFQFPQHQPPNNYFNGYPQGDGFPWLAKAAATTGKADCKDGRESATKGALESTTTIKSATSTTGPSTKSTTTSSSTAFPKVHYIDDRINDLEPTTGDRGLDDFAVTTSATPKARNLLSTNNNNNIWVPII